MANYNQNSSYEARRTHFIERAQALWGDAYDYSDMDFTTGKQPCMIRCPKHGMFRVAMAQNHILKNERFRTGCPYCGNSPETDRRLCHEKAVKRKAEKEARKKEREAKWKAEREKREAKTKVLFAEQKQCVADHGYDVTVMTKTQIYQHYASIKGTEALAPFIEACRKERERKRQEATVLRQQREQERLLQRTEELVAKAREVHGNKYDYSQARYEKKMYHGKMQYVIANIRCPKHGIFDSRVDVHITRQCECPLCAGHIQDLPIEERQKIFIEKSKARFPGRFSYRRVKYVNKNTPVTLFCKEHKVSFQVTPDTHLGGPGGCPCCSPSVGEAAIYRWLYNHNINFRSQEVIPNPNKELNQDTLRVDFYLPDQDLYIEMNGKQHYEDIAFFRNRKNKYWSFEKQQLRDRTLRSWCRKNHHHLLTIRYDYINRIPSILGRAVKKYSA